MGEKPLSTQGKKEVLCWEGFLDGKEIHYIKKYDEKNTKKVLPLYIKRDTVIHSIKNYIIKK